jgi:hypothetical protein
MSIELCILLQIQYLLFNPNLAIASIQNNDISCAITNHVTIDFHFNVCCTIWAIKIMIKYSKK